MGYWNVLAVGQFRDKVSPEALDVLFELAVLCYDDDTDGTPARIYYGGQLGLAYRMGLPMDAGPRQVAQARQRMSRRFHELRDAKAIEQVKAHGPGRKGVWLLLLDVPAKPRRRRPKLW